MGDAHELENGDMTGCTLVARRWRLRGYGHIGEIGGRDDCQWRLVATCGTVHTRMKAHCSDNGTKTVWCVEERRKGHQKKGSEQKGPPRTVGP